MRIASLLRAGLIGAALAALASLTNAADVSRGDASGGIASPVVGTIAGDTKAGESIYERCIACHALAYDRTGPRHCGLFGRKAGSVPGYAYSDAMRGSGLVWNEKTLDRFLADPTGVVPGTTMGYAGVKDAHERADLIAWLREAGRDC